MDREVSDMDSLFEGMDFVMPLEDESPFGGVGHNPEAKPFIERELSEEVSTLRASHILPTIVSSQPQISPPMDPTSPMPSPGLGPYFRSSTAVPSLPLTRNHSEPLSPAPVFTSSYGGLQRDPSEPLDESLFSGLTMSSVDDESASEPSISESSESQTNRRTSTTATATGNTLQTSVTSGQYERSRSRDESSGGEMIGNGQKKKGSMESIFAGYYDLSSAKNSSTGTPPISRAGSGSPSSASLSVKPSMRRKKRSMKIGYGREEEEIVEVALRKAATGEVNIGYGREEEEIVGVALRKVATGEVIDERPVGKNDLRTGSTSFRSNGLSKESPRFPLHTEESTTLRPGLRGDAEVLNGAELNTAETVGGSHISTSNSSPSVNNTIEIDSAVKVASREISDEGVDQLENMSDANPTQPYIATRLEECFSSKEHSYISTVESASSEGDGTAEPLSAGLRSTASNVETPLDQIDGGGVETIQDDDDLDVESLAQHREGTIQEKLEYVNEAIAHKVKVLQGKSCAMSASRKLAVQKRRRAAEKVSSASSKYKELEAELNAACEREDFEKADALSGSMTKAENEMAEAAEAFRLAEAESDFSTLKVQEVLRLQVTVEEKGASLLEFLKQEAEDFAEKVLKEAQETASREMERLLVEEKTTELKRAKLGLELKYVKEMSAELNKAIEDSTKSESEERKALIEKKDQLDVELQDLMAQVRIKEVEIAEYAKCIEAVDEKMSSMVATFIKQKTDLVARSEILATSALQLENEANLVSAGKQAVEKVLANAEEESCSLYKVAKLALDVGKAMQEAVDIKKAIAMTTAQSRAKRTHLILKEKLAQEEAVLLHQDASSTRALLQELTSMKVKLSQELSTAKERIIFVEKRAPELDTEKKLAAAARNFKVAGRLAAEGKVLTAEKEAVSADMARINKDLKTVEKEAEVTLQAMAELDNLATMKEREAAMAHCERLRLLADAARDERDAAIGLEDFKEAESLDSEAKAADAEADDLQRLYQLECREYENQNKSKVSEDTDFKEKESAMASCERLRLVAAAARDERDAVVELDHHAEAEILESKSEAADAEADRLQRLYQLEGQQFENQSNLNTSDNADSSLREAAMANCALVGGCVCQGCKRCSN